MTDVPHRTVTETDGSFEEYYHLPPDELDAMLAGAPFQVIRQEWQNDYTERHIYEVVLS